MQKIIVVIILYLLSFVPVFSATTASQTVSANLDRGGGGGGGGIPGGAVVGIAGGGAASGASALAFAPLLLAGLEPNGVVCAAAPLECIQNIENYLQCAIVNHFGDAQKIIAAMKKIQEGVGISNKFYFAQNDCVIINGTYEIDEVVIPKELLNAQKLRINLTVVSDSYIEVNSTPELKLGLYKDINKINLAKKFETQQFLHHYLMKRYEIPLNPTLKEYNRGLQKLSGIIDMKSIQNKQLPASIVVRYTEGGFRRHLKAQNPKTLRYAYLAEFEKIK